MFTQFKKTSFGIALGLILLTSPGCFWLLIGAGAGAGSVAWTKGTLEKNFDASLDRTYDASKKAFAKLGLELIIDERDDLRAKLIAEYPDGKKASIKIKALTERATELKIRVGVFGHRIRSDSILTAVQRYL